MTVTHEQARVRRYRKEITLDSQAAGSIVLFTVPAGSEFAYGLITSSVTLGGTATIAVGVAGTTAKYKAAATFTTANVPVLFGLSSAMDDGALAENETVLLTSAAAALPASGTLTVDMYFTGV
jgi:hypothetical protein